MEINRSTRLEKHLTFGILLMVYYFYTFLKALHFSKFFQIFEIHQKLMLKLLNAIFFSDHCRPNTLEHYLSIFDD